MKQYKCQAFEKLNIETYPDFKQWVLKNTELDEFPVVEYYARTGPSWIAKNQQLFSSEPRKVEDMLRFAFENPWRKINIIGANKYLFIDLDKLTVGLIHENFSEPFELELK